MPKRITRKELPKPLKAITVYPQWAWAIMHAGKDVENRSWNTHQRGIVAIHASIPKPRKKYEEDRREINRKSPRKKLPSYEDLPNNAIVGLVEITGCKNSAKSKWFYRGNKAFILARPTPLKTPITHPGWLNFWKVPSVKFKKIAAQLK